MAVSVAPGICVAVGRAVGVGVTGVPVGAGLLGVAGTSATATTLVGTGVAVAEGAGLALWASATVRAVTRSIRPASDTPTMTYRPQRNAVELNVWRVDPRVTDIPLNYPYQTQHAAGH